MEYEPLVIRSEKQDNGLWGMPLRVVAIDRIVLDLTPVNELLRSAIIMGLAEHYPNHSIDIRFSDENGFIAFLKDYYGLGEEPKCFNCKYENYRLEDNTLHYES